MAQGLGEFSYGHLMDDTIRISIPVEDAAADRDTDLICVELEAWFIATLLGYSRIIAQNRAWSGTEEQVYNAVMAAQAQQEALMGIVTCNGVAAMELSKGGYLVSINQTGDKTYVSNQMSSSDIENMPAEQSEDNTNDNVCAGVNLLVERLLDDVLFSLDQAQLVTDQFKTAAEALTSIGNAIPLWSQSFGVMIDGWEEWAVAAASLTISTLKIAYGDPAVKLKMRENLYCAITAHVNNIFQESDYFGAVAGLPLLESQSSLLAAFFAGFYIPATGDIFDTVLRWYNLGCLNEDNTCAAEFNECLETWEHTFDFTVSDGGFVPSSTSPSPTATYAAGVGWQSGLQNVGGGWHRLLQIKYNLAESADFTGMIVLNDVTKGTYSSEGTAPQYLGIGAGELEPVTPPSAMPPDPWEWLGSQSGDIVGVSISVGVNPGSDPGGQATITEITFTGTGENPFLV